MKTTLRQSLAILSRMASDWIFPKGGPFPYQLLQAAFLSLALVLMWPRLEIVFLRGGKNSEALRAALIALPLAFALALTFAFARFGRPYWPSLNLTALMIANSLFFPAVEELEFRGFLLSWLLLDGAKPTYAIWLQALLHTIAHIQRLWQGDFISFFSTLLLTAWFGALAYHWRSLWGAYLAHSLWNIALFLPLLGGSQPLR